MYCNKCGTSFEIDNNFCPKCGAENKEENLAKNGLNQSMITKKPRMKTYQTIALIGVSIVVLSMILILTFPPEGQKIKDVSVITQEISSAFNTQVVGVGGNKLDNYFKNMYQQVIDEKYNECKALNKIDCDKKREIMMGQVKMSTNAFVKQINDKPSEWNLVIYGLLDACEKGSQSKEQCDQGKEIYRLFCEDERVTYLTACDDPRLKQ